MLGKQGFKIAMLIAVGLLAACQNKELAGPPVVNGNWASSDGVYVAEFLNGSFRAIANDNGSVISEGSYFVYSKEKIQLKWTSNISGQTNQAECVKPDINQMNCTDTNGKNFSLRRSA